MTVTSFEITPESGDRLVVTLFTDGTRPSLVLSVEDADQTAVPSVQLTLSEAADLREALRDLSERAVRELPWTTRR